MVGISIRALCDCVKAAAIRGRLNIEQKLSLSINVLRTFCGWAAFDKDTSRVLNEFFQSKIDIGIN